MNDHHAPKDNGRLHRTSSAVPAAAATMPVLKATTGHTIDSVHHSHAAAAAHVAAAAQATVAAQATAAIQATASAQATAAAQTMAYDPAPKTSDEGRPYPKMSDEGRPYPKTSDEGRPYHPVRTESDRRGSDNRDYRKKSSEKRKGSAKHVTDDYDDEEQSDSLFRRRDSEATPVDPEEVLRFLQETQGGKRPIAHIGTVLDHHDRLPARRLRIHPPPATKDLYEDNDRIKLNRSYKLRYNFLRKQGSVPSSMQAHMQRFKKPPFKRVWKPGWCVDNISDRLAKLSGKQQKP